MQPKYEVADVLRHTDPSLLSLTVHQQKTLRAIAQCRTAALGGHVDACDDCGNISISYNSCRNRHCPKCQGHKRIEWIENRSADLLPCTYYHVVFTLPQTMNALALHKPALVYDALFKAVWQTLSQFGKNEGVQLGMIAVLHTCTKHTGGAKPEPASSPALHCARRRHRQQRAMEKTNPQQQIFVFGKSTGQSVPCQICTAAEGAGH
jgi:Transposase zinc-binding domain